ncbi:hypothetical protein GCM10009539_79290 [Cryptosporangium japonicum]|uniref:Uncharacterized protein n=1 Tax=Cryptosporangium japonicum TaxID=80872 RepID=A0ABP3EXN4_9ACTN
MIAAGDTGGVPAPVSPGPGGRGPGRAADPAFAADAGVGVFARVGLRRLTAVNTATRTRGLSVGPAILRIETDEEVPDARYRCPW